MSTPMQRLLLSREAPFPGIPIPGALHHRTVAARSRSANRPPRACCRAALRAGLSAGPKVLSVGRERLPVQPNSVLDGGHDPKRWAFRIATTYRRCCASSATSCWARPGAGSGLFAPYLTTSWPNSGREIDRPDTLGRSKWRQRAVYRPACARDGKAVPVVSRDFFYFSFSSRADSRAAGMVV